MSGLYLHIPYCKQVCNYCDFHFRASLNDKTAMLAAMKHEMLLQKKYLNQKLLETLYFGGGTPSVLSLLELEDLMSEVKASFPLAEGAEITLEANPDDLNKSYLDGLIALGINRLSIGIQSFDPKILKWMNRRHTAEMAIHSVREAQDAGFKNINIDLIYGFPGLSPMLWENTLYQGFSLEVQHLSAYHLTIEPRTVFGVHQRRGQSFSIPEEDSIQQFHVLRSMALGRGWNHYEISNFSLSGFHSRHNSAYWQQKKYLGIGPSAHSFDGHSRHWNVSNNTQYIQKIREGTLWFDREVLSEQEQYNDYILTSLRTSRGVDGIYIKNRFGADYYQRFRFASESYIREGYLCLQNGDTFILTEQGMFVADRVASDLFIVQ